MEQAIITKEIAAHAVLCGACRVPTVGQPISSLSTRDLVWAEGVGFSQADIGASLPLWTLSGYGSGSGYGYGYGYGSGYGYGYGYGYGSGYGYGYGYGYGSGYGYGDGDGSGDGSGDGYGYGDGKDLGKLILSIQEK